jgi:hypothetical protein
VAGTGVDPVTPRFSGALGASSVERVDQRERTKLSLDQSSCAALAQALDKELADVNTPGAIVGVRVSTRAS